MEVTSNCRIFKTIHALFIRKHFHKQLQTKIGQKLKQKLSNTGGWTLDKNVQNNKIVCLNEIIWLITMKMKMIMKIDHIINRPRSKHGHKKIMSICMQHFSNIWGSTYEKVKQHWGWVEKSVAYKKSLYLIIIVVIYCYLESKICKVLTFYVINSSCFEISPSLF